MQGISLYKRKTVFFTKTNTLLYHTYHERNGEYLEREGETNDFLVLSAIDDCDPSGFYTSEGLNDLILDLNKVIHIANKRGDSLAANHLKEILVLAKLCLWNLGEMILIISPYEYVPEEDYPKYMPEKYLKKYCTIR